MRARRLLALAALLLASCSKPKPFPPPKDLGTFQVESGKLFVVDPCYPEQESEIAKLGAVVANAKKGAWTLAISMVDTGDGGPRCAELHARHESVGSTAGVKWRRREGLIGVDSGQAGIFDGKYYHAKSVVPKDHVWKEKMIDPDDAWYSLCCERTLGSSQAGVIPFGAVSSSGFGDGAYEWDSVEEGGEVVAVRVLFLKPGDF